MDGALLQRVALREYLPFAALILTWLLIGAVVGHADAVRLLAAIIFVRTARVLTSPAAIPPLRKRLRSGQHQRQATWVAMTVEAAVLPLTAGVLAAILALLWSEGQQEVVLLAISFAPALLVRTVMPLATGRGTLRLYRPTNALVGLALALLGWAMAADVQQFALLFAVREWLALAVAYLLAPPLKPRDETIGPLHWQEIADRSFARGRRLAAYRFGKLFLNALLGPFGTIVARTGRGFRAHRKLEPFVPQHGGVLGAIAAVSAAVAVGLILWIPKPALLLAAATLLRTAATAGNILIWGQLSRNAAEVDDADLDEEEE
jgi:hypothetical protein